MSNKTAGVVTARLSTENDGNQICKESSHGHGLWKDGLICGFEFIQCCDQRNYIKSGLKTRPARRTLIQDLDYQDQRAYSSCACTFDKSLRTSGDPAVSEESEDHNECSFHKNQLTKGKLESHWVPIGWERIYQLTKSVRVDKYKVSATMEESNDDEDLTVADVAAPYWEKPAGPTWWCHVLPGHPFVDSWLRNAQWLHPAIRTALRDESRLISERMKHLYYEVPVRVSGGLLFELLGQSVGDPYTYEDDIPIVLRSWQAQNFLITALHVKGISSNINILGITEVQDTLIAGGNKSPKSAHELIAYLACRLTRWDDRLFRKNIFGASDEVELKFINRRNNEDLNLLSIILNQEIKRLSTQVIRVKWSLHAREEIVFELLHQLRGHSTKLILEDIRKSTRMMIEEQEAVRARLFTIQDVMQSTVRAWLQDKSIRITHNLAVFGGCGLVLSIITGLFGINVDGIPGASNTPYAFALFSVMLFIVGGLLIGLGMLYLGLRKPITEEQIQVRRLELQDLVKTFQHDAESHAKVRQGPVYLSPTAADLLPVDADYILIEH